MVTAAYIDHQPELPNLSNIRGISQAPVHADLLYRERETLAFLYSLNPKFKQLAKMPGSHVAAWLKSYGIEYLRNDLLLSQNTFNTRRLTSLLAEFGALFADIDFYKVAKYAGLSPEKIYDLVREHLLSAGVPLPTWAVSSGSGLQTVWVLIPGYGLPDMAEWRAVQDTIYRVLQELGSDYRAKSVTQVFTISRID